MKDIKDYFIEQIRQTEPLTEKHRKKLNRKRNDNISKDKLDKRLLYYIVRDNKRYSVDMHEIWEEDLDSLGDKLEDLEFEMFHLGLYPIFVRKH